MSWPYLKAATELRLPTSLKIVALALGDFSEVNGQVCASNARIQRWTGQTHQTVRVQLRELQRRELTLTLTAAGPLSAARLKLQYPGVRPLEIRGPLDVRDLNTSSEVLQNLELNDRSLIPSNKSRKAGTAGAAPVENLGNEPTTKQVTKFVHELMADNRYDHQTLNADLTADMKSLLRTRNFDYDTPLGLENLRKGIDSGLAQYARAKGQQR